MAARKKIHLPTVVRSWRDLGREGHGRAYANGSPWARQGIFIQGLNTSATRESGPGVSKERQAVLVEAKAKIEAPHDFVEANWLCVVCHMLREGHDRLVARSQ